MRRKDPEASRRRGRADRRAAALPETAFDGPLVQTVPPETVRNNPAHRPAVPEAGSDDPVHAVQKSFPNKNSRRDPVRRITWKIFIDMVTPGAVLLSALNPALLGVLLSFQQDGSLSPLLTLFLLLIPVAANCSVNLLNDYYDYVGGNDTLDNIVAEAEGPLAYHEVEDPRPALFYGLAFFAAACLMGVYIVCRCGPVPALIGAFGAAVTVTYSGRWISTSHLPVGEFLSGFTMGGLIPFAVYSCLTGRLDWIVLWKSVPMMLVVSQFMLENNTCDMERDAAAGRRTLPMFLGRERAEYLAKILSVFWLAQLVLLVAVYFPFGIPVLAMALWTGRKGIKGMFREARTRDNKLPATGALASMAFWISEGYLAAAAFHLIVRYLI